MLSANRSSRTSCIVLVNGITWAALVVLVPAIQTVLTSRLTCSGRIFSKLAFSDAEVQVPQQVRPGNQLTFGVSIRRSSFQPKEEAHGGCHSRTFVLSIRPRCGKWRQATADRD